MRVPSNNKNQINRGRGATLGAAGSGRAVSFERKPQFDEHHRPSAGLGGEGLRGGGDKRQGDLQNAAPRDSSEAGRLGEQRTPHQDAQPGADVRTPFIEDVDRLPAGLRRERTHPLNPTDGRGGDVPDHVPNAPPTSRQS
jgi:hypothetical protein